MLDYVLPVKTEKSNAAVANISGYTDNHQSSRVIQRQVGDTVPASIKVKVVSPFSVRLRGYPPTAGRHCGKTPRGRCPGQRRGHL